MYVARIQNTDHPGNITLTEAFITEEEAMEEAAAYMHGPEEVNVISASASREEKRKYLFGVLGEVEDDTLDALTVSTF